MARPLKSVLVTSSDKLARIAPVCARTEYLLAIATPEAQPGRPDSADEELHGLYVVNDTRPGEGAAADAAIWAPPEGASDLDARGTPYFKFNLRGHLYAEFSGTLYATGGTQDWIVSIWEVRRCVERPRDRAAIPPLSALLNRDKAYVVPPFARRMAAVRAIVCNDAAGNAFTLGPDPIPIWAEAHTITSTDLAPVWAWFEN